MKKWWKIIVAVPLLLALAWHCIFGAVFPPKIADRWAKFPFQVHFIDVAHGDSVLVCCEGHYMLIDAGMPMWSKKVQKYLAKCGVTKLDVLVASHEHWDHAGGLQGVARNIPFDRAMAPITKADCVMKGYFNRFAAEVAKKGVTLERPKLGDTWNLGSAKVTVVGPVRYDYGDPSADDDDPHAENNHSLAFRITFGANSILLAGDAETLAHDDMRHSGMELCSDVVKVCHHGIRQDYDFYDAVAPRYAVLSGFYNSIKKSSRIEEYLPKHGVELWLTRKSGSIVCASDGHQWTVGPAASDG